MKVYKLTIVLIFSVVLINCTCSDQNFDEITAINARHVELLSSSSSTATTIEQQLGGIARPAAGLEETDFYMEEFNASDSIDAFDSASLGVDKALHLAMLPNCSGRALYHKAIRFIHIVKGLNGTVAMGCPFSTEFVFSIDNGTTVGVHEHQANNSDEENQGTPDGMTFFIASKKYAGGLEQSMGPFLGLLNSTTNGSPDSHTFAVEFDTFQNSVFGDINGNHVGVNMNSMKSLKAANVGPSIDLKSGHKIHAWIDYSDYRKEVEVRLSMHEYSKPNKPENPLLSVDVDLSSLLEEEMYVGFSAGTGPLSPGIHYRVYSWSFSNHGEAAPLLAKAQYTATSTSFMLFRSKRFLIPASIVTTAVLVTIFAMVVRVAVLKRRFAASHHIVQVELNGEDMGLQKFSYGILRKATRGFHKQQLLGKGGFGAVYKGVLPYTSSRMSASTKGGVAVKRIFKGSNQGSKEFMAEVSIIGRLRHRNLVPLIGWCNQKELLLVYELMPHGSLDKLIFNNNPSSVLPLFLRTKILTGVAAALVYLHEECEQRIVHRDVKASNVLLDADYNARLGDFGLARVYHHNDSEQSVEQETNIVGTWGYLAPDFCITRKASDKTDVYSFGILMLEVVCGRRVGELIDDRHWSLLEWLRQLDERELGEAVDQRLRDQGGFDVQQACALMQVGLLCSHSDPATRPSMRRVLHFLQGDSPVSLVIS